MKKNITYSALFAVSLFFAVNMSAQRQVPELYCGVRDSIVQATPRDFSMPIKTNSSDLLDNPNGVIVIPVVFHILYDPSVPEQNVSDYSINFLLESLNKDLTATNGDLQSTPQVWHDRLGNVGVRLKLACVDPNGNSTSGIVRKQVPIATLFLQNSSGVGVFPSAQLTSLGGDDAWLTDTYLNIWVGNFNQNGWGMTPMRRLETSTFLDANNNPVTMPNSNFDGIILRYECFPPPEGEPIPISLELRRATHEVGHWLGLYHIYNGCSPGDYVDDTPAQSKSTDGCPTFPLLGDVCSPVSSGVMFMNYMDYTNSICKHLFTHGQADRIRTYFSENGPSGTRFPFLVNYFSIQKQSGTPPVEPVQNNTITIKLNNPACLDVTYTFTGPVTEVSHTNQQIVFSVDCPSTGTVNLTAHSMDLDNPAQLGNYIDSYVFNFDNSTNCETGLWPKEYCGKSVYFFDISSDGNILMYAHEFSKSPILNHDGVIPTEDGEITFQYSLDGYTSWFKSGLNTVSIIKPNIAQMFYNLPPYSTQYFNCNDGSATSPPIILPNWEKIIAVTSSGDFITADYNNIYVHFISGNIETIQVDYYSQIIFNKSSNLLYVINENDPDNNFVGNFKVFKIETNNFVLMYSNTFSFNEWNYVVQIDNQNNVYMLKNGVLYTYNYVTNTLGSPLNITGFANNSIKPFGYSDGYQYHSYGGYTQNNCLLYQESDGNIYFIDFTL